MNNEKDRKHDEINEPVLDGAIDEPVLDGAEEPQKEDVDPRKGKTDPALIRHPEKGDKTTAPYNLS